MNMDNQENLSQQNSQTSGGAQNPPVTPNTTTPAATPSSSTPPSVTSAPAPTPSTAPPTFPTATPKESEPVSPLVSQPVVIPASEEKLPKWFYILFLSVVIVFITLTVLLIFNFLQKQNLNENLSPLGNISVTPQPTVEIIEPTPTPEATDSALLKLSNLTESDDLNDLEKEVDESSLTFIDEDLEALDNDLVITSP